MRLVIPFSIYITCQIAYSTSSYQTYIKHIIPNMSSEQREGYALNKGQDAAFDHAKILNYIFQKLW